MKQLARQESSTENTTTQPSFICGFDDGARSTACTNPAPDDASYCSQHDPEVVTIERSYLVRVVQTYTGRLPESREERTDDVDQFICDNFLLVSDETETVDEDELQVILRHPDGSAEAL
ncbi:Uncharacterised protein [Mycobacteroides abscessus subsp. abscessus]|uniref:Uncharacterized protein n=5 Tax=Mycobacteroides abscessus TaxID=36809 RepID=A0AB74FAD4_9MYCO|nr:MULTISPECIES: hypothetical protein [Mycobacteroides]MDB2197412.1 hypothetical protein [Mycobacteroides abscessus subsp. abscessus]MDB2202909.1 hypothetical protein [Mycobacteroides abscessus subsp. abscessus]MDB2308709.1 hypothetical protein [Mycobacteroides abscessus subsp. massiliense]MDM2402225.1 hypothetical protein [Mycobacteroides abscessus]MDM2412355.1 hypothetical protein [Mycobacteroides abscessus]